jgi:hypothetical protein
VLWAADSARIALVPKFVAGQVFVYHIETQTSTAGKTTTPIVNTEGPTQASLTIDLRERLEVLHVDPHPDGEAVTLRITWDASRADTESDALDPTAQNPAAPYGKLEGQSMELTLSPDGALSNFKGLEDILPGGVPPADSVAWISLLTASAGFPHGGIAVGQQWKSELPIAGAPLARLVWQTQATYQRNEACQPLPGASTTGVSSQQCAVILTQMQVARHGSSHSDATPDEYLRNGLRTSGTWTGSGALLGSISIQTGMLVSATETSSQNMDYEIKSASTGSSIHYTAKVQNQTGITLVDILQPNAGSGR